MEKTVDSSLTGRQTLALRSASRSPFNPAARKNREYIALKRLKLSTLLTVDYLITTWAWHASVAVVDPVSFVPVDSNKISKADKERIQKYLEDMLEGVGGAELKRSESFGTFNLFRYLTKEEARGIQKKVV